jgi:hypothetical protein
MIAGDFSRENTGSFFVSVVVYGLDVCSGSRAHGRVEKVFRGYPWVKVVSIDSK